MSRTFCHPERLNIVNSQLCHSERSGSGAEERGTSNFCERSEN